MKLDLNFDTYNELIYSIVWGFGLAMVFKKVCNNNCIVIREDRLHNTNEVLKNNKAQSKEHLLSEIIFEVKSKEDIQSKYNEVVKSINDIGFKNSAATYSFSESAKIGGDIGWVNENSLNDAIKENINSLQIGEITKPIILSNGILILKLMNTKNIKITIDIENEYKKAINYERNRQLDQYSKIYYNKIKKNLDFNG